MVSPYPKHKINKECKQKNPIFNILGVKGKKAIKWETQNFSEKKNTPLSNPP